MSVFTVGYSRMLWNNAANEIHIILYYITMATGKYGHIRCLHSPATDINKSIAINN